MIKRFILNNWLWLAVAAVVLFFGSKLLHAFGRGGVLNTNAAEAGEQSKKKIDAIVTNPEKMTKTQEAINSIAERLYEAMYDLGTDEDVIFSALQGLNTEDLKAVYKAFGVREENLFWLFSIKSGDLIVWFEDELTASSFEKVKTLFSKTGLL